MMKYEVHNPSRASAGVNYQCVAVDALCVGANGFCLAADAFCAGVNLTCPNLYCKNKGCYASVGGGFGGGGGGSWRLPGSNK